MEGHSSTFKENIQVLLTDQKVSKVERKKWLMIWQTRLAYLQKDHQLSEISITDDS